MNTKRHQKAKCCLCGVALGSGNYFPFDFKRYYYICKPCRRKRALDWKKFKMAWSKGVIITTEMWKKAEVVAFKILKGEGFSQITDVSKFFPFDYLCKRNGQIYAFEVTTMWRKDIGKYKLKLLAFAGWVMVFLFISPDFSKYRIIEIAKPSHRYVSVFSKLYPSEIMQIHQQYLMRETSCM